MKLGYIVLAHEKYQTLEPLLSTLTQNSDDVVVLHYDAAQPHAEDIEKIQQHFPSILFAKREKVEWGEASIVRATLNGMRTLIEHDVQPNYVTLLSGSCFPIKPRDTLVNYLWQNNGKQFIECHDLWRSGSWVKAGLEWERWELFHYINWRKHPKLFSLSEKLQRKMGIKRRFPYGHTMYMGSQWWTLTYQLIEEIVSITDKENLLPFINKTWIPDEFYFQTLVGNIVGDKQYVASPLMHYRFNHTGIPKVFTHSDTNELREANGFFARKIQQSDHNLVTQLKNRYLHSAEFTHSDSEIVADNVRWYKKYGFKNWIQDYPLPIVIIIDSDSGSKNPTGELINSHFEGLNVFGNLFDHDVIDFSPSESLGLYDDNDHRFRDYDWQEFLTHIAYQSPNGFAFLTQSRQLNPMIDELKSCPNVMFIDMCQNLQSIDDIKQSYTLEYYLKHERCQYTRISDQDTENTKSAIQEHIDNNLFLKLSRYG